MKTLNVSIAFALFALVGCVGAEPNVADVNGGYHDTWKEPVDDTYQPPSDNGSDGSDATDSTDANDGSDVVEDTYQPPKEEDTAEADTATGPQEGEPCDDGNQCTASDCWHDGECVGKEVDCDDNDATTTDYCDPETGCNHVKEVVECKDTISCTIDVIEEGECKHKPTSAACDDGNACTTDSCNAATGCSYVTKTCDDGKECTTDSCNTVTGSCKAVEICADGYSCGTGGKCVADAPEDGTGCDDNNACTYADRYQGGTCKGSAKDCDDGNACTTDSCNAATGCSNIAKACGDGKSCTTDWCSSETGGCVNEVNCDDGKTTTTDSCNASGECVHTVIQNGPQVGDSCNDNDSCTINDVIVAGGQCVGVAKCGANQTCTAGICYDSVPVSPYKEVTVKWYPTFQTYHVTFMGWYCKGGSLSADGTTASGCSDWSEWKEFANWNGNPNPSQLVKTFYVPKGSWLFFNPMFNLVYEGPNSDWCDSAGGFSTGVAWEVWVDGVKLSMEIKSNHATGCNGRVWIPN